MSGVSASVLGSLGRGASRVLAFGVRHHLLISLFASRLPSLIVSRSELRPDCSVVCAVSTLFVCGVHGLGGLGGLADSV